MPATTSPLSPSQLKEADIAQLSELKELLHLLYHRNNNQHRHSMWWADLAKFRRELGHLLEELDRLNRLKRSERKQLDERLQARVVAWRDIYVQQWFSAFSQLTASKRFANVGIVLLASLARVCSLLGITQSYDALAAANALDTSLRPRLQQYTETDAQYLQGRVEQGWFDEAGDNEENHTILGGEDLGEVIGRGNDDGPAKETMPQEKPTRKKRKSKKGSAIDDIFDQLDGGRDEPEQERSLQWE